MPHDEFKHVKTFVVLLIDDSTAQDPNNVMHIIQFIVDCNAVVILNSFFKRYAASNTSGRTITKCEFRVRKRVNG
jgi:hypothetical protein